MTIKSIQGLHCPPTHHVVHHEVVCVDHHKLIPISAQEHRVVRVEDLGLARVGRRPHGKLADLRAQKTIEFGRGEAGRGLGQGGDVDGQRGADQAGPGGGRRRAAGDET